MMAAESSGVRSVNSVVICGAVTRMIRKAKNPMSAIVTAPIAMIRDAPSDLKNAMEACTGTPLESARERLTRQELPSLWLLRG